MKRLVLLALVVVMAGCTSHLPPNLTPPAQTAWYGSHVVTVLDTAREGAFVLNQNAPPAITTHDTKEIVLWHQAVVGAVWVSPGGWKPVVLASIYSLTCFPEAADPDHPVDCPSPRLSAAALAKWGPYIRLGLFALEQIVETRDVTSEEVLKAFNDKCKASLAQDEDWLKNHGG